MERKNNLPINNAFYDDLNAMWYQSTDHPIALLRAENELRNPWIDQVLEGHFQRPCKVLDVGCGGGFLTHYLAKKGHQVSGIDLSEQSLKIARQFDSSKLIHYTRGTAYDLPFADNSFDAVSAMDLLEHVEDPQQVINEASRVLKKGGLFFFHTFNRNPLSYIIVIKGVEWCFSNAPANMHVYPLFIKPKELTKQCKKHQLLVKEIKGVRPCINKAFMKLLFTRKVEESFRFTFSSSLATGYCGYAEKE